MFLNLLKTHWTSLGLGAALLSALISLLVVSNQRDAARAERDLARNEVSVLGSQIKAQNEAVLALEAAAAENREIYLAGLEAASRKAVRLEINAEDYLNTPIPSDPTEACKVADRVLTGVTR